MLYKIKYEISDKKLSVYTKNAAFIMDENFNVYPATSQEEIQTIYNKCKIDGDLKNILEGFKDHIERLEEYNIDDKKRNIRNMKENINTVKFQRLLIFDYIKNSVMHTDWIHEYKINYKTKGLKWCLC